jgi:hypothetical protein
VGKFLLLLVIFCLLSEYCLQHFVLKHVYSMRFTGARKAILFVNFYCVFSVLSSKEGTLATKHVFCTLSCMSTFVYSLWCHFILCFN